MSTANLTVADASELEKQQACAEDLAAKGFDFGLAVGSAFVESMRNTYYRHTGTALDELIDNAIEAGASNIHIALGYSDRSEKKPDAIAVIDDGHGMVTKMVRMAVLWGGTHREGQRTGFGRFGFGLPSASVNQARRFSVYSITEGGRWHGVSVDLDEIRNGDYNDPATGRVVAPDVAEVSPPTWVQQYVEKNFPGGSLARGTIVLWEKLDRLTWKTTSGITKHLLEHFGVTYRNYLSQVNLFFDEKRVEPTDPLFTTPGFRYFDVDEDRATALDEAVVEVASKHSNEKVLVRIRYARFPLSFFLLDKSKKKAMKGNQNQRFSVMTNNFGIIVCRMGRQIDVVERTPWANLEKFRNDDRYWAAEIDFPAELDEEFTISNAKQGVVLSDRFWDLLKDAGMEKALRDLRRGITDDQKVQDTEEPADEKRPSEASMEESGKFRRTRADTDPIEREKKAKEALEQHVKRKARETKRPEEEVRQAFEEEAAKHPYRVEFEHMPGAPFYRVEQLGGMQVLYVNRAHRFYSDIYSAADSSRRVRAALEVLLFSIGDCELDAQGNPDRKMFYAVERQAWSETLATALEILNRFVHDTEIVDVEGTAAAAE